MAGILENHTKKAFLNTGPSGDPLKMGFYYFHRFSWKYKVPFEKLPPWTMEVLKCTYFNCKFWKNSLK